MPASMMMAPVGSSPKVTGRSIVIVAIGPMPGRTPMSVPTTHPMNASPRFWSENATEKPSARCETRPSIDRLHVDDAGDNQDRDREAERELEQADAERRHDEREHHELDRPRLGRRGAAHDDDDRARQREPDRADGEGEREDRERHEYRPAQRPAAERLSALHQRGDGEDGAPGEDEERDRARERPRSDRAQSPDGKVGARPERDRRD